jgi:DNA-binding transcriptional ArsR family regulator
MPKNYCRCIFEYREFIDEISLTEKAVCATIHLDSHLNVRGDDMGIANTFKALSDSTRREILSLLASGSMTAGEISEKFEMTSATISHHLSVLREAGLISDEKKGKYICYELNMSMMDEIMSWIINLKGDKNNGNS